MSVPFSRTIRSLSSDTSRPSFLAWMLAGLVLTAWAGWFVFGRVTVYEVSPEARLEVERSAHPIAALAAGKIVKIAVSLGQKVTAGEVLVELDSTSERLRLREETARLQAFPPQLATLEHQIADLESARDEGRRAAVNAIEAARSRHKEASAAARFAGEHARRLSELRETGLLPEMDLFRVVSESEKLHAAMDAQLSDVRRQEMEMQTRVHQAEAEIEDRKRQAAFLKGQKETIAATIVRLTQEIERHRVRAPADGRIGDVLPLQEGAYVAEGEKLGSVVPAGALRIVAEFDPPSVLGRIHPGQTARMRLDGFPWAQYGTVPAMVDRVASEIRNHRVRVEFRPKAVSVSNLSLQHGLPGSIEVELEQTTPAILVLRAVGQALAAPAVARSGNPVVESP